MSTRNRVILGLCTTVAGICSVIHANKINNQSKCNVCLAKPYCKTFKKD